MKRFTYSVTCLTLLAGPWACTQEQAPPADVPAQTAQESFAVMGSISPLFEMVKGYIIASAEQIPEDLLTYRPNPEVRTFGEILGHVAMTQYWFCNAAVGEGPEPENYEELTAKADLVSAVQTAFDHCAAAYAMNDTWAMETVELWGETNTRLWVLSYNLTHAWEHYGNLVTYLRANGMVPPSSQGGM